MSMLSAQCDELRELAGDGSMEWVAGPIRASMLREAADTIWQLRDDLQRANEAVRDAEHDESRAWDRVRKAESENEKLRELCETFGMIANGAVCDYYERDEMLEQANANARELGVDT